VEATGIAVRRGKKIAIVTLARRMAGVLLAMMRDRTCYLQAALSHRRLNSPDSTYGPSVVTATGLSAVREASAPPSSDKKPSAAAALC